MFGVAAFGLSFTGYPVLAVAAPGPCVTVGSVTTCTGDHSTGIASGADFNNPGPGTTQTLSVNSLTGAINPALNTDGINFTSNLGVVNINANTGPFGITTTGTGNGIEARTDGQITINNIGNINAGNDGIFASEDADGSASVTSVGDITAGWRGIRAAVDGSGPVTVHSTGNIVTTTGDGISTDISDTGDNSVTSIGNITTANGDGINAITETGIVMVNTNGNIAATGGNGIDVQVRRSGSMLITTRGSVSGQAGIFVSNRNVATPPAATINNHGTLTGTNGFAIDLRQNGNDVVNLFGGTVLNGSIDFGNGNDGMGGANPLDIDTLNIGPGLNITVNFADAGGFGQGNTATQSAPEIINVAGGFVLVNTGTQVIAIDPTGFAASALFLDGLSGSIFDNIDNEPSGPQSAGSTHGAGGSDPLGMRPAAWVSGFGGFRDEPGNSRLAGIDHRFGGVMGGVEYGPDDNLLGLFGGYGRSDLDLEFGAGNVDVESYFAGGYWKRDYGSHRIHLAFAGGTTDHDYTRNIAGGGAAKGNADGWFIAPSATLAVPVEMLAVPLVASLRAGYAGLFLDGYTETGIATPLTVSSRDVHLFNARAQLAVPHLRVNADGSHTHVELRFGADGRFEAGSDNVNATVGGAAMAFSADMDDEIGAFAGATLAHSSASGAATMTLSGEVQSVDGDEFQVSGQARITFRF